MHYPKGLAPRKYFSIILPVLLLSGWMGTFSVTAQIITTIAGNGIEGYSGDGGLAVNAEMGAPTNIVVSKTGEVYFSDDLFSVIRKIDTNGIISTIAGTGVNGYSGDGGPAINAMLFYPNGLALDSLGNLFVADEDNARIRKITPAGIITTYAGIGLSGYSGDGGPAYFAQINNAGELAFDKKGNLYLTDYGNCNIRKVDQNGIITTVAGAGCSPFNGDNIPALNAFLSYPGSTAIDKKNNLYISVSYNEYRIRKVDTNMIITTIAGNGIHGSTGNGGLAINAEVSPGYLTIDPAGKLYFTDYPGVRVIDQAGIVSAFAGNGQTIYYGDGGPPLLAGMSAWSISFDEIGNAYIADDQNHRIRKITMPNNIQEFQKDFRILSLFPNPADAVIQIHTERKCFSLILRDMMGNEIYHCNLPSGELNMQIPCSSYEEGMYFLDAAFEAGVVTRKIIIQN